MEGFDFDLFPRIVSFRVTIIRRGKDPLDLASTSNTLTTEMKNAIMTAPLGTKCYFEYIKASMPDKTTRQLSPLNFVLN